MQVLIPKSYCFYFKSSCIRTLQTLSIRQVNDLCGKMAKVRTNKAAPQQIVLKAPKGTRDRNPVQMRVLEKVFGVIQDCFKRHDAVSIETPVFELKDVLTGKYGEESKLIYNLEDQGGELLSLRYDLTVPFARYVAMNKIKSIKRFQIGKVYRRDQPAMNRGRFREFYQCDFDIAGDYGLMLPDSECLRIIYEVLTELDLGDFVIKVNHRRLLDGLFTACGVPAEKFTAACSSVDKLDKLPWEEVRKELVEEKGLPEAVVKLIGEYTQISGGMDVLDRLAGDERLADNKTIQNTLPELRTLLDYCQALGIMDRLRLDLSLARGLDYYTGVIYEAVLTGFIHNPITAAVSAAPAQAAEQPQGKKSKRPAAADEIEDAGDTEGAVGSVAGGGRYDNLVDLFCPGSRVPCVGLSFGIERLLAVSEMLSKRNAAGAKSVLRATETDVMVIVAHKGLIVARLELCRLLWDAKIKAAFSHKNQPKILDQLQYCESTGIPIAVIIGDGELQRGVVKLRRISSRDEREVLRSELPAEIKRELQELSSSDAI
uniref:histidine--tRNA ligase n=1 Tax=Schistocephalus solidus TaxID=70667 RepID=A0A0X3PID1_SCHSO